MPGWYVHMEAAKEAARRLQAGDVPASLGFQPNEAEQLGDLAHKWRNYLAIGSLGPDLFYLLPDFKPPYADVLLSVVSWVLDEWENVDDLFLDSWETWMGPIGANDSALTAQLTGGLSNQLGQALDQLCATAFNAILSLASRLGDIFGLLTSGPPQGFPDSLFYWSDMFHYRHTYLFPRTLWDMAVQHAADADSLEVALTSAGRIPTAEELAALADDRADAEAEKAFAIGWMTHCATDVTGHAFTNAKCGAPFRLSWNRHHVVENHMDGAAYDLAHHGAMHYEELGTSALHFRIAFRTRSDPPYDGRHDAPAYDYFGQFPGYPLGETAIDAATRKMFFDMDAGDLPEHLSQLIITAMSAVYGDDPKILVDVDDFSDGAPTNPSGRPNADALNVMWDLAFRYLRHTSRDGLSPRKPQPPTLVNEHPFPSPPGSTLPAENDGRGGDPNDDNDSGTGRGRRRHAIDLFLNLLAWIKYIGQVILWLVTIVPGLILDVATFPAREFLYYTVIAPLYSLYMASRKLLVMEGFLLPKPEEIDEGLVTLGISSGFRRHTLMAAINNVLGFAPAPTVPFDEPSGRAKPTDEWGADPAFPRQTMKDPIPQINQLLAPLGLSLPMGEEKNSHWTMPWRYPNEDLAGDRVGWEPHLTHPGPWLQGARATELFARADTHLGAAQSFESATDETATSQACAAHLPLDQHLGNPIDYSLYLVQRLTNGVDIPDFNLDADRGYAYHCWDWDRHAAGPLTADPHPPDDFRVYDPADLPHWAHDPTRFDHQQACTVPEQFDPAKAATDAPSSRHAVNRYRPAVPLHLHYLGQVGAECTDAESVLQFPEATPAERDQAGMNPDGSER